MASSSDHLDGGGGAAVLTEESTAAFSFDFTLGSREEALLILELRRELSAELNALAGFPELVDDHKLLRFLRGYVKPLGGVRVPPSSIRPVCPDTYPH